MDDYKRGLLMRVRDRLMDPNRYHPGLCDCLTDELEDDGALIDDSEFFIKGFNYEMDQLFDYRMWDKHLLSTAMPYEFNPGYNYWWYPPDWVEPRITMIDFLLNNR